MSLRETSGDVRPAGSEQSAALELIRTRLVTALGGLRGVVDGGLPPLLFAVVHAVVGGDHDAFGGSGFGHRRGRNDRLGHRGRAAHPSRTPAPGPRRGWPAWRSRSPSPCRPGKRGDSSPPRHLRRRRLRDRVPRFRAGRPAGDRVHLRLDVRPARSMAPRRVPAPHPHLGHRRCVLVFAGACERAGLLYLADQPALLAVGKLVLGWPLTVLAVVLTVAAIGRARHA